MPRTVSATDDHDFVQAIVKAADGRQERLVKMRRRLHAQPEASGVEFETTSLVAETLREFGLEPKVMAEGTGVIADIDLGSPSGSFIALRSELDCVKVNDDKQTPYASTQPGLSHSCGHDAHTTVLLATASMLQEQHAELARRSFSHNLRFVFQPSEETATGARSMIQQGALNGVEAILAVHVDPFLEARSIGLRSGPITSACKIFRINVRGRSGHSARPHEAVDPIPAATTIVNMFYQLAPRAIDSRYPMSLTVASIESGSSFNAIPDRATISGTLRAARLIELETVQKQMESVVAGVAEATGCDAEIEYLHSCPATDNDPDIVNFFADAAQMTLGDESVVWLDVPSLGGEDFAFYQELIPGAIVRLGAAMRDPRLRRPLHSSLFDIDEDALVAGAKVMSMAALRSAALFEPKRA